MPSNTIDLYRIAVMSVNELVRADRPPAAIRVDLEALKALVDVMIAKLPKNTEEVSDGQ